MNEDLPAHIKYWSSEASHHDCFFLVGPESGQAVERIGALKVFLMGHSEPFRVMFGNSPLAEINDVRVTDVDPKTFKIFLSCLYGASDLIIPKLDLQSSAKLLYIAEKYLVDHIKTKIDSRLSKSVSSKNVCLFLRYPILLKCVMLEKEILSILQSGFEEIMYSEKALEIHKESLLWLLQQNDFHVKEIQIWDIVLKWAKHQVSSTDKKVLRTLMAPFLKHIRFLTMELKEFCKTVVPEDVLTETEVYALCKSFGTHEPPNCDRVCGLKKSRDITQRPLQITEVTIKHATLSGYAAVLVSAFMGGIHEEQYSQPFHFSGFSWNIGAYFNTNDNPMQLMLHLQCNFQQNQSKCYVSGEFSVLTTGDSIKRFFGVALDDYNNVCTVKYHWHKLRMSGITKEGPFVALLRFSCQTKQGGNSR